VGLRTWYIPKKRQVAIIILRCFFVSQGKHLYLRFLLGESSNKVFLFLKEKGLYLRFFLGEFKKSRHVAK